MVAWIIVLGFVFRWLANKLIGRLIVRSLAGERRRRQRAETLASVMRSIISFVIFSIVAMMVLSALGFDIGPLVASAGLVGVALGFGAQSLVKDFLSGLFMFFEDQCGVGDHVIIGETEGTVEALSLRVTRLRGKDGNIWYLRNGEILKLGNVSQGPGPESIEPVTQPVVPPA
jgi:small conductance mechanosensitive channel